MPADPKPRKRHRATQQEWEQLRIQACENARWRCQACSEMRTLTIHHLVPRSQGGDDTIGNLMALCGHGTAGCHGDVTANRPHALAAVRRNLTPQQTRYIIERKGEAWLDRRYPL